MNRRTNIFLPYASISVYVFQISTCLSDIDPVLTSIFSGDGST